MKQKLIQTKDGSATIEIPELHVTYHSRHGAVQEAMHVYIQAGLCYALHKFPEGTLSLFEMGLGTGLNAWLTLKKAAFHKREIRYTAVEKFPLSLSDIEGLNYGDENKAIYELLHHCKWDQPQLITNDFVLHKIKSDLFDYKNNNAFHLIYYDAFAPRAQPELWTIDVFQQVYNLLLPGGILVTYCAKGDVRRNLLAAGFIITKLPGPPGKREMIRAEKNVASLL